MNHNDFDRLGGIIKTARKAKGLTRDQLSERIHITPRYLMSIENENQKPSYKILFQVIRELKISTDTIFFPENKCTNTEREQLIPLLSLCDERDLRIVTAMVKTLLETKQHITNKIF
ncbi:MULTISPECIES: helix-turn-helix transcriptional regulator [Dehalobacter]|jgi:transcriptional regulator with XRE-family HTH domain|uniref:Helix-turn-helix domain-containing protein n=2 Tax=Dehalobacter restrictus TaxID=55583 RepID=A0A857DH79_9FIRM|nr:MULTISPECIES: helix-turn-helix transcriptional regulator [Dehalobacter]AHF09058.1 XRE family transcriptional regulator [Dehalobacter restrictus DSM 9455]MCG1024927.1 helix-turn-helix transcriptional regulator [Dehalobacter sp.]QGZ99585.1 helix-turn-helix domain-containing protein [Dehalobacter restrictus]